MVGSDPSLNTTTTVPVVIIPLKMNFVAAGQDTSVLNNYEGDMGYHAVPVTHTFDGGSKVQPTLDSPIFTAAQYPTSLGGDLGQSGDVYMRAQFGKIGSSYHVELQPSVLPTVTLNVPSSKGIAYVRPAGALAGILPRPGLARRSTPASAATRPAANADPTERLGRRPASFLLASATRGHRR